MIDEKEIDDIYNDEDFTASKLTKPEQPQEIKQPEVQTPEVPENKPDFSDVESMYNDEDFSISKVNKIGDNMFSSFTPSVNKEPEKVIEDYVEKNPEEAKVVLPEESSLHEEAEQVNDGDKRTDEVKNEAVEEFIKEEPNLANEIVEEAADDNSVLDDKSIVSDKPVEEADESDFEVLDIGDQDIDEYVKQVEAQENSKNPEAAQFVKEVDEKLAQMDPIEAELMRKKIDNAFKAWGKRQGSLGSYRDVKNTEPGVYDKGIEKARKLLNDPGAIKRSKYIDVKDPEKREYIREKYGDDFLHKIDQRNLLRDLDKNSLEKANFISKQLYEPKSSQDDKNKSRYDVNDDLRKTGNSDQINWNKSPDFNPRTGKVNTRQAKKLEQARSYKKDLEQNAELRKLVEKEKDFNYTQWWTKSKDQLYKELGDKSLSDLSVEELKNKLHDPDSSISRGEIKSELAYQTGNGSVLATTPDRNWSQERFDEYSDKLEKALQELDPNNPDSLQQLQEIQKMKESLEAANVDRLEIVENYEEEINETSVDPNEAALELMNQEAKEKSEQKRLEEFIKQQSAEIKKKYSEEPDYDPEERKKLNKADKQLAIYNPKALVVTDKKIDKIEEQIKEKEEKIRKKWKLPKLDLSYHGKPIEGHSVGFSQSPTKEIEGPKGISSHVSPKAGAFPTGHGGAGVSYSGSHFTPKDLRKDVGGTSGVHTISAQPMVEQVETPNASVKGNKYTTEGGGSSGKVPGIMGWKTVSGGRINSTKGKAPHFSGSSGGSSGGSTLKRMTKNDNHITKKSVAQKILSASHNWPVDEQGYHDSQDKYLPVRFYVKDDTIEISILGTGRKRKSFDGITDQELQLVSRLI